MPPLDKELEEFNPEPMRILAYGAAKMKKTWWAGKAAESGFNVILIDSDNGAHILNNIAVEARSRITHIKTVGHTDDSSIPAEFLTRLLTGKPFLWDEPERKIAPTVEMRFERHSHYYIDISKLTMNDVLVIDSWTKVANSLIYRWFMQNNIEFTSLNRAREGKGNQRTHRGMFGWTRQMATWLTNQMLTLPCHVIVIAHQTVYEKRKVDEQGNEVVEWSRTQPISTSGPHAMQMAVDFSEILFFSRAMQFFKIDTAGETLREGGCRFTPPSSYSWDDLQFVDICKIANSPMPDTMEEQTAFRWFAAGEYMPDDLLGNLPHTGGILPASQPATSSKPLFSNLLGGDNSG